MSDKVQVSATLAMTVKEVLTAAEMPTANSEDERTLDHSKLNKSETIDESSSPRPEEAVATEITIGAGTTTIDLTSAPLSASRTADLTGEKCLGYLIKVDDSAAGDVTIAPGSSNPYNLDKGGNDIVLGPGEIAQRWMPDGNRAAVSATVKNIDVSGTENDKVSILAIFGS